MTSDFWVRRRRPPKSAEDHYRERRARRRRQVADGAAFPLTLEMIADRDNLYHCYRELQRDGGQAPGIDGVHYPDLSNGEVGELLGDLSRRVLDYSYRPQPARRVEIAKPGTTRMRTLSIPVILDRVLAKAVSDALSPFWEAKFLDCSWGFRPIRNSWGMLLAIEDAIRSSGCTVLAIDDIQNAFDNVPIAEVDVAHKTLLAEIERDAPPVFGRATVARRDEKKKLLWLVETVLRGDDPSRTRGIPQGNNYSPTALNGLLNTFLDGPITDTLRPPLWARYADNLCALVRSVPEGEQTLTAIRQLLAPLGMSLKGEDGVFDLKKDTGAQLLGFMLSIRKKKLIYGLGKKARNQLRRGLETSYDKAHPHESALLVLKGWFNSCGPAFETGDVDVAMILNDAAEYGFRELATPTEVRQMVQDARDAWIRFRLRSRVQGRSVE